MSVHIVRVGSVAAAVVSVLASALAAPPHAVAAPTAESRHRSLGLLRDVVASNVVASRTLLPDETTATSQTWQLANGERLTEIASGPVRFQDESDEWTAISNEFVDSETVGVAVENAANEVQVELPSDASQRAVRVTKADAWVSFRMEGLDGSPTVDGTTATFADADAVAGGRGAAEVEYEATTSGVKESIVLDEAPATAPVYGFRLRASTGLRPELTASGEIEIDGADGEAVFVMPAPFMLDSAPTPAISTDVSFGLDPSNDGSWRLTVRPALEWLTAPGRVFPVVVDPTTSSATATDTKDCWITDEVTTQANCDSADYIKVGKRDGYERRGLIQFNTDSVVPSTAFVESASLTMYLAAVTYNPGNTAELVARRLTDVPEVSTGGFSSSKTTWLNRFTGMPWATPGGDYQLSSSPGTFPSLSTGPKSLDATGPVQAWFQGNQENKGLLVRALGSPNQVYAFCTSDQNPCPTSSTSPRPPTLAITYNSAPSVPSNLGVDPCVAPCNAPTLETSSRTPELLATVSDAEDPNLTASFEVLQADGSAIPGWDGLGSDDTLNDGVNPNTAIARLPVPGEVLKAGQVYKFRVKATDDHSSSNWSAWQAFAVSADPDPLTPLLLAEPVLTTDSGATLSWTRFVPASASAEDQLAEYQIFRGCESALTAVTDTQAPDRCTPNSNLPDAFPGDLTPSDAVVLVDRVDRDQLSWTDTTAATTTSASDAKYRYWVIARTSADVAARRHGTTASNGHDVVTTREGRVRRLFTGDIADATVVSGLPAAPLPSKLRAGTGQVEGTTSQGTQRAVLRFDVSAVPAGRVVTEARMSVHQHGGGPSTATTASFFDLHALTSPLFAEDTVTWNRASDATPWPASSLGGAYAPAALASVNVVPTETNQTRLFDNTGSGSADALTSAAQGWVNDGATNFGFLIKRRLETSTGYLELARSESTDPAVLINPFAPKLSVEYLGNTSTEAISAPQTPQRLMPNTSETVAVRVTNTTASTWPSNLQVGYRWQPLPSGTLTTGTPVSLGRVLAPGESVEVNLAVAAPINSDTGSKQLDYDLFLELWDPSANSGAGGWFGRPWVTRSLTTMTQPQISDARAAGFCTMLDQGLWCPNRVVQDRSSEELGLEEFNTYTGESTGSGSGLMANLHNGNLAWSYDAFANPSVGPSMFTRVTYNSLDVKNSQDDGSEIAGEGWSVQPGTLTRLGSKLGFGANDATVTLFDGDGTKHTWADPNPGDSIKLYDHPAGVDLDLTYDAATTNDKRRWRLTRPDGTRFFFDATNNTTKGRPTFVQDLAGNELTFNYTMPANSPKELLTSVTDAAGRTVATLTYRSDWKRLQSIRDISGRALKFGYDTSDRLQTITDGGSYDDQSATFAAGAPKKVFTFGYFGTNSANTNTRLSDVTDPRGRVTTLHYWDTNGSTDLSQDVNHVPSDSGVNGWVENWTDRRGQKTSIDYVRSENSPKARVTATVKDVLQTSPALTAQTVYVSDALGRTTKVTDANNRTIQLVWDSDHHVIQLTDPRGAVSRWVYDQATGQPLKIWDAEAVANGTAATMLAYVPLTRSGETRAQLLKTIATPKGNTTTFGFTDGTGDVASGLLKTVTDPRGAVTTYGYDARGQLTSSTDPRGFATTYTYAPVTTAVDVGYPTRITPPTADPATTEFTAVKPTDFTYDTRGNVLSTTQQGEGTTVTTSAVYDAFGRPTSITAPGAQGGSRTTSTTYDLNDNVTTTVGPSGAVTLTAYENDDQPDTTTLPSNGSSGTRVAKYDYTLAGWLKTQTSPLDKMTALAYDAVGQLTSMTTADNAVTTYTYDPAGNLATVTDPNSHTSRATYDLLGRPVSTVDALNYATRTSYDLDGNVVRTVNQRGDATDYTYTNRSELETVTVQHTPISGQRESRTTTFRYDLAGNQDRTTSPSGRKVDITFDALNRPWAQYRPYTGTTPPSTTPVSYTRYDELGRVKRVSDAATVGTATTALNWTNYAYFKSGEVKTATDPWGIQTQYTYTLLGQQSQRTLLGTPDQATNTKPQRVMSWGYWPDGSLRSREDSGAPSDPVVLDNAASNSTTWTRTGTWQSATVAAGEDTGLVGTTYITHDAAAAGSSAANDSATWTWTATAPSRYRIQVSCPRYTDPTPGSSATRVLASDATYTVTSPSKTETVQIDQREACADRDWITLGTRALTAGQAVSATLKPSADPNTNDTVVPVVIADAMRVIPSDTDLAYTYTYDADGNQKSMTDSTDGAVVGEYAMTYDAVGRPLTMKENATPSATQALRSTTYTYDPAGLVKKIEATRSARNLNDKYRDSLGATRTLDYTYDSRNLLDTLTSTTSATGSQARTWDYDYDPAGQLAQLTKPEAASGAPTGNKVRYTYHSDGLLRTKVERTNPAGNETLIASHQLWYTTDGDLSKDIAKVDRAAASGYLDRTAAYTYTPDRLLASVTKTGANKGNNETYTYDAAGNILTQQVDGQVTTNHYDKNRLDYADYSGTAAGHRNYIYDNFGRLKQVTLGTTSPTVESQYTYDGFDNVKLQTKKTGSVVVTTESTFDPMNRKTWQGVQVGAGAVKESRYTYLGRTDQVATEEEYGTKSGASSAAWNTTKAYTFGPDGKPIALAATPLTSTATTNRYYSTNWHGDVESLTDPATGSNSSTYRYSAYGQTDKTGTTGTEDTADENSAGAGTLLNPYRYNGKRLNPATGSYDMGFRDYEPGLNRFTSRDMYNGALDDLSLGTDPWNTNRYAFTGGNPITRVELDGHYSTADDNGDYDYSEGRPSPVTASGGAGSGGGNSSAWNPHEWEQQITEGAADEVVSTVKGLAGLAKDVVMSEALGDQDAYQRLEDRVSGAAYVATHPVDSASAIADSCQEIGGARCFGHAAVIAGSMLFGGAASNAGRLSKVARMGAVVGQVGKVGAGGVFAEAASAIRMAAKGGDDAVQLFRHAGPEELADLKATGTFNLGKNSTGKYFADNADDASKWGAWLNGGEGGVVSTTVPRSFADQMMRWEKLDAIGPARFASPEQLDVLNRLMSGIGFH